MKKGQWSTLQSYILVIGAGALLLIIGIMISTSGQKGVSDQTCRKCIEIANTISGPKVACKCPRQELLIKFKEITRDGKTIDQDLAHKKLADGMRNCLNKYHSGDLDPVADFADISDESICRPCYDIVFDGKLRKVMKEGVEKLGNIPPSNLKARSEVYKDYTITNPLPYLLRKIRPSDPESETYWEYLLKEPAPSGFGDTLALEQAGLYEGSTIQLRYFREDDSKFNGLAAGLGVELGLLVAGVAIVVTGGIAAPAAIAALGSIASTTFAVGATTLAAAAGAAVGGAVINYPTVAITELLRDTGSSTTTFEDIQDLSTFMLAFPDKNAFKNCAKCENAAGGVMILPPGFDLSAEWVVPDVDERWPVCSLLLG